MAARGNAIGGWWAWWPFHGDEYARNFKTEEDAIAYIPNVKTKHGKPYPLGDKLIMRVVWDWSKSEWSHDAPVIYTQEQVEKQFLAQGELNATTERPAA